MSVHLAGGGDIRYCSLTSQAAWCQAITGQVNESLPHPSMFAVVYKVYQCVVQMSSECTQQLTV